MKRFHVHLHVDDIPASVAFYSTMFAAEPARLETDYAKWMLDDPRVNFAISTRGSKSGIDHLGIQAETQEDLAELKTRAREADMSVLDEGLASCCYARSEKHWVVDPQGIAWEHFQTLATIPVFSEETRATPAPAASAPSTAAASTPASKRSCCAPRAAAPVLSDERAGMA